jgi:hypothetical protein
MLNSLKWLVLTLLLAIFLSIYAEVKQQEVFVNQGQSQVSMSLRCFD